MNNVLQMKEKQNTFTTTISHSPFAMRVENTTEAKQTHQVIVLDSITSSAKSSVFRKQSLSLSLSIHYVKDHTAKQQYPEFDYISVQYKYNSCKLKQAP